MLLASLNMKLSHVEHGVCYYTTNIVVGKKTQTLIIPRYDPFLGWVELFGLPPQHEWVVLKAPKPFEKDAVLKIGDKEVQEHIVFNTDPSAKAHSIMLSRTIGKSIEQFHWTEDYSHAPDRIYSSGTFSHNKGIYHYEVTKRLIALPAVGGVFTPKQSTFISSTVEERGLPDQCWLKEFSAQGTIPPLLDSFFNTSKIVEASNVIGFALEMGYLAGTGATIDRMHGDWYKLLSLNDTLFKIEEGNFTSTDVELRGVTQKVKDTYSVNLHSYSL